VWCDNTQEMLAATLRPGKAGSNTTADHIVYCRKTLKLRSPRAVRTEAVSRMSADSSSTPGDGAQSGVAPVEHGQLVTHRNGPFGGRGADHAGAPMNSTFSPAPAEEATTGAGWVTTRSSQAVRCPGKISSSRIKAVFHF
jgi:hypothetical protein